MFCATADECCLLELPPYAGRSKSLEVLIPILYLKGISTGDFAEALSASLGPNAGGLSASTIVRLKEVLSSEPKCNTPADLIIGTVDQDLRECCHAMLFAFVG